MQLHEIFKKDKIKLHLKSVEKDELFEELTDLFLATEKNISREEILSALRERENKMSTGIKNGIAIPHARITGLKQITGVLGVSDEGIDYDSLDKKPVYLIFMFLSSPEQKEEHLTLLRKISLVIENEKIINEIVNFKDSESLYFKIMEIDEL